MDSVLSQMEFSGNNEIDSIDDFNESKLRAIIMIINSKSIHICLYVKDLINFNECKYFNCN